MNEISALIIACNEAGNIERAIRSLAGMAEVIVLDSGSSDGTAEIAERAGAKVFRTDWPGFAGQRRRALEKASRPWCLFLDADEELNETLIETLRELKPETGVSGYYLKRSNYFLGKELKHGRWANDWQLRLFLKSNATIIESKVHEGVQVSGIVGKLAKGYLNHNTVPTLENYFKKFNRYTTLEAEQKKSRGKGFSLLKLLFSPVVEFWKLYLFQGGFLDGIPGLSVASLSALYKFTVMAKIYEKQKTATQVVSQE